MKLCQKFEESWFKPNYNHDRMPKITTKVSFNSCKWQFNERNVYSL